jgi:hypothetical protein
MVTSDQRNTSSRHYAEKYGDSNIPADDSCRQWVNLWEENEPMIWTNPRDSRMSRMERNKMIHGWSDTGSRSDSQIRLQFKLWRWTMEETGVFHDSASRVSETQMWENLRTSEVRMTKTQHWPWEILNRVYNTVEKRLLAHVDGFTCRAVTLGQFHTQLG